MYSKHLGLTLVVLATFLAAFPASAQHPWADWWENDRGDPWNGVPIRQGWHVEWFRGGEGRYEGVNSGEVAYIWSDCRSTDRGVYMQVIDTNGDLKFDGAGIKISDTPNRQEDPAVWPSADGGWFVGWEDFEADDLGDIHCTKIDADGNRLWGDDRGVIVCDIGQTIQEDIRIVEDRDGGCIMAWRDRRRGDEGDIFAMHILEDGSLDPDWAEDGIPIVAENGPQVDHTADSDGEGGMIIAWKDGRDEDDDNIWAQRINPDGELMWGGGRGIIVCNNGAHQESPKLCPDGSHGAFFTLVDRRNQEQTGKDIYVQRVNANGQLLWGEGGTPLCTVQEEQSDNRIVASGSGAAIILWQDMRNDRATFDVYTQRISGVNEMVREWNPATGVPVVTAARDQIEARLYADHSNGAYYAWQDVRDFGHPESDIYVQHINNNGAPTWGENGIPICRIPGPQLGPLLRRTTDGGCVVAWNDWRSGSSAIYTQRLDRNGNVAWVENGIALVDSIDNNAQQLKLLSHYDSRFTVVWLDGRRGGLGLIPYIQHCRDASPNLVTMLVNDGIPVISDTIGGAEILDAVNDESGGTFLVWEDHRTTDPAFSIYAQHVSAEGELLWGQEGLLVSEDDFEFEKLAPKVCYDGDGGIFVAWKSNTHEHYINIFMQHIDGDGNKLWNENDELNRMSYNEMDETLEALISDGQGGAVLIWQADAGVRSTSFDLWGMRVDADGNFLWGDGQTGLIICDEAKKQSDTQLIRHQNGYALAWVDERWSQEDEPERDIAGQIINPDGSFRWHDNGAFICGFQYPQDSPAIAIDNEGNLWVAWVDYRYGNSNRKADIFIQKVSSRPSQDSNATALLDNENGVEICNAIDNQWNPVVVHDLHNGVYLMWEDYRTGLLADIYGTHLDRYGHNMEGWQPNGNIICDAYYKQELPVADILNKAHYGISGIVATWIDKRATGKQDLFNIFAQRICDYTQSVGEPVRPQTPVGYSLEEAYPNPFNAQTVITFTTPVETYVSLELYDVTGRFIRQIAKEWVSAGRHPAVIEAKNLAAGSYLVKFEANGVEIDRKIELIK